LIACALVAGVVIWLAGSATPVLVPDSDSYLQFSPYRTASYPLFVRLVGLDFLVPAQLLSYALGCAALGVAALKLTGRLWLALLLIAAVFVNPEVMSFQRSVVSEALFIPVLVVWLASLFLLVQHVSMRNAALAGALAGLAATVRPASYPIILVALLAIWIGSRQAGFSKKIQIILICVLSWGSLVAAERLYSRAAHGAALTSLAGPHIYAKASLIEAPPIERKGLDSTEHVLTEAMEAEYASVRKVLRQADGTSVYPAMLAHYEQCIQHRCTHRYRPSGASASAEFNAAMGRVGTKRILQRPLAFLPLAWEEYRALWVLGTRTHPDRARRFDDFIEASRPLPLEAHLPELLHPTEPRSSARFVGPAFVLIGVALAGITMIFGFIALRTPNRSNAVNTAFFSALTVQAVFVFTSVTGIGDGRYTMGMWPAIASALVLAGAALLELRKGPAASQSLSNPQRSG